MPFQYNLHSDLRSPDSPPPPMVTQTKMLFGGYLITRNEAKRFTKSEGSIDNMLDCINIMIKFREFIMQHGGTMETVQYPKAIPDLENSAFLVITSAGAICGSRSGPLAPSAVLTTKRY